MTDAATLMTDVGAVEDRLAACDLCALRIRVISPRVEEIKITFNLRHGRQHFRAAARPIRIQTPDARHCDLRGKERAFKVNDVVNDFGSGWLALQSARHKAVS